MGNVDEGANSRCLEGLVALEFHPRRLRGTKSQHLIKDPSDISKFAASREYSWGLHMVIRQTSGHFKS